MKLMLGRGVKNKWDKALRGLVLPAGPRTPELLLREYVEQVRGNRLFLTRDPSVASPNGPSGMWVTSGNVDLVWIHPGATGILERRIIAHETGHMINGDLPDPVSLTDVMKLLRSMCTNVPASLWESSMCRTDFDDPREQGAEAFSYYAEEWLSRTLPPGTGLADNMRQCLDIRKEYR